MVNKKFYIGIVLAMALASCNNDELANNINESVLKATVESSSVSRVGFDKSNSWSFFWHNGDNIWVNGDVMYTDAADKSKTATFKGYDVNTTEGYAVYPYELADKNVSGTTLTWNFPNTYNYTEMYENKNLDKDFFESSQDIPMYAKVENGSAAFKHLGAIAVFKLNDWNFTGEHVFTLTTSKKITGKFTTDLASSPLFETTTASEDVVTINYTRPTNATEKTIVFYVPIPTGTYDIQARVKVGGETILNKPYTNINVECGDIVWAEYGESTMVGGEGANKIVSSVEAIKNNNEVWSTNEDNLTVKVTGEVTGQSNVITVPSSLQTENTTFTFASIAQDATIEINAENDTYAGKIIIEVPQGVTAKQIAVDVPNGEVYIKQGNVETLIAASKNNATYICAGVSVTTLIVEKGNVRIENGGNVETIKRSDYNTDEVTYVIYEGNVPTTPNTDQNIKYVSAAEWDLKEAVAAGGTVTLGCDVELSKTLEVNNTVVLNLNGHNLTISNESTELGEGDGIIVYGNLTINGEGIVTAKTRAVWARGDSNAEITINGGTYVGANESNASVVYASGNGKVIINGGTFEAKTADKTSYANKTEGVYAAINMHDKCTGGVYVNGGTFVNFNPANPGTELAAWNAEHPNGFVTAGYSSVAENNGNYVVSQGIKNETALVAAIAAGGVITLDADIDLTSPIIVENTVTLNLNGKTITTPTPEEGDEGVDAFQVTGSGSLTINGDGSIKATMDCVWAMDNAHVVINGGNFEAACEAVYAKGNAQVEINNGFFKVEGEWGQTYTLNLKDDSRETASITVKGGTFYKFNPADNAAEGVDTNFVEVGYSSTINSEGNYEVTGGIKNETALVAAIATGGVITLDADIDLTSPIIVENTVTLNLNGKAITTPTPEEGDEGVDAFQVTGSGSLTINGDGSIKATMDCIWAMDNAHVVINGGNFEAACEAVYAKGNAQVEINNGFFKVEGEWGQTYTLNLKDDSRETASITVKGGTFYKFNPADNAAEGADTNFVSGGCTVEEKTINNETWYSVVNDSAE